MTISIIPLEKHPGFFSTFLACLSFLSLHIIPSILQHQFLPRVNFCQGKAQTESTLIRKEGVSFDGILLYLKTWRTSPHTPPQPEIRGAEQPALYMFLWHIVTLRAAKSTREAAR